jgi:hypothetical protein
MDDPNVPLSTGELVMELVDGQAEAAARQTISQALPWACSDL